MKALLVVALLVALGLALPLEKKLSGQALVDHVNSQQTTWKAAFNPRFANLTHEEIRQKFLGAKFTREHPHVAKFKSQNGPKLRVDPNAIPKEFDARTNWPKCADVIGDIPDQSACGSCWAVAAAKAMSDRVCIGTDGADKTSVSAIDLVSCCYDCGYGCNGGWPSEAFYTWVYDGIVSGSGYEEDQGCKPYPFLKCEHHTDKTTYPPCSNYKFETPQCEKKCKVGYPTAYNDDKSRGKKFTYIWTGDVAEIQTEIMTNGPVSMSFLVAEDFLSYSEGIYQHVGGDFVGGHAVRAIGWGEENGTPYWLISNNWNEDWGENGLFRMIRGKDNCEIEEDIVAALYAA